jgi:hypothetical protein
VCFELLCMVMSYSFKVPVLLLQLIQRFPFRRNTEILESALCFFDIDIITDDSVNLGQFSLIMNNLKHVILKKYTHQRTELL